MNPILLLLLLSAAGNFGNSAGTAFPMAVKTGDFSLDGVLSKLQMTVNTLNKLNQISRINQISQINHSDQALPDPQPANQISDDFAELAQPAPSFGLPASGDIQKAIESIKPLLGMLNNSTVSANSDSSPK